MAIGGGRRISQKMVFFFFIFKGSFFSDVCGERRTPNNELEDPFAMYA